MDLLHATGSRDADGAVGRTRRRRLDFTRRAREVSLTFAIWRGKIDLSRILEEAATVHPLDPGGREAVLTALRQPGRVEGLLRFPWTPLPAEVAATTAERLLAEAAPLKLAELVAAQADVLPPSLLEEALVKLGAALADPRLPRDEKVEAIGALGQRGYSPSARVDAWLGEQMDTARKNASELAVPFALISSARGRPPPGAVDLIRAEISACWWEAQEAMLRGLIRGGTDLAEVESLVLEALHHHSSDLEGCIALLGAWAETGRSLDRPALEAAISENPPFTRAILLEARDAFAAQGRAPVGRVYRERGHVRLHPRASTASSAFLERAVEEIAHLSLSGESATSPGAARRRNFVVQALIPAARARGEAALVAEDRDAFQHLTRAAEEAHAQLSAGRPVDHDTLSSLRSAGDALLRTRLEPLADTAVNRARSRLASFGARLQRTREISMALESWASHPDPSRPTLSEVPGRSGRGGLAGTGLSAAEVTQRTPLGTGGAKTPPSHLRLTASPPPEGWSQYFALDAGLGRSGAGFRVDRARAPIPSPSSGFRLPWTERFSPKPRMHLTVAALEGTLPEAWALPLPRGTQAHGLTSTPPSSRFSTERFRSGQRFEVGPGVEQVEFTVELPEAPPRLGEETLSQHQARLRHALGATLFSELLETGGGTPPSVLDPVTRLQRERNAPGAPRFPAAFEAALDRIGGGLADGALSIRQGVEAVAGFVRNHYAYDWDFAARAGLDEFDPNAPGALADYFQRIHHDPPPGKLGRGVCQQFADLGVEALRRLGVPTLYECGLKFADSTIDPALQQHAWVGAFGLAAGGALSIVPVDPTPAGPPRPRRPEAKEPSRPGDHPVAAEAPSPERDPAPEEPPLSSETLAAVKNFLAATLLDPHRASPSSTSDAPTLSLREHVRGSDLAPEVRATRLSELRAHWWIGRARASDPERLEALIDAAGLSDGESRAVRRLLTGG